MAFIQGESSGSSFCWLAFKTLIARSIVYHVWPNLTFREKCYCLSVLVSIHVCNFPYL